MTYSYREYSVRPTPGHDDWVIYRPVIPVQVRGPAGKSVTVMGLLDTGADATLLPAFVLGEIGAKYAGAESAEYRAVGGQKVTAHYSQVELAVDDAAESYRWTANIGFLDGPHVAILGQIGFLEYFNLTFNNERRRVMLRANKRMPSGAA